MGVPRRMLPEIRPSMEVYGEANGALACTYGTGSFLLMNTGEQPVRSNNGLLSARWTGWTTRVSLAEPAAQPSPPNVFAATAISSRDDVAPGSWWPMLRGPR